MAPAGTVTVILVEVAEVTVARVAPKKTILLAALLLKLVPDTVTSSPGFPEIGVNEDIVGTWASADGAMIIKHVNTIKKLSALLRAILKCIFDCMV